MQQFFPPAEIAGKVASADLHKERIADEPDIRQVRGSRRGFLEACLARQEFRAALLEVVAFHHPGTPAEVEQEAAGLLKALS